MGKEKLGKNRTDIFSFFTCRVGAFSKIRTGDQIEFKNIGDSLVKFVYNNGVSVNVIKDLMS